jgi:hypothetical protein
MRKDQTPKTVADCMVEQFENPGLDYGRDFLREAGAISGLGFEDVPIEILRKSRAKKSPSRRIKPNA